MGVSTIPAVKAALVEALQGLTGSGGSLEGAEVTWSVERPPQAIKDWIMVGKATGDQISAALGQQRRDERYTIEVIVSVVRPNREDARATAETACGYAASIEDHIRPLTQPPLGVTDLLWILVEKTDLEEIVDAEEREARVTIHLGCRARI